MLSRYWLVGRRRAGRRLGERGSVYVDRYEPVELILALGIMCFSALDLGLTLLHLDAGGAEANPIMAWLIDAGSETDFGFVKLGMTAIEIRSLGIAQNNRFGIDELLHHQGTNCPIGNLSSMLAYRLAVDVKLPEFLGPFVALTLGRFPPKHKRNFQVLFQKLNLLFRKVGHWIVERD